ncbi:uncharacterized protein LOC142338377 [Convolutriloba macropyga]|uniref:uncharacterized protein LOC142338377 n=1 Tax=Convolutriloba macropyga TaxID=536237 RepID=UPI003F51EA52
MLNARIGNGSSLEDEMSKFEQELSSLQQISQPSPLAPPPAFPSRAPTLAFTPQVLLRPQVVPLAPPPRPPTFCFSMTQPQPAHGLVSMAPNFRPHHPVGNPIHPTPLFPGKPIDTGNLPGTINSNQPWVKYEPSNLIIESSPSIYKTPKQPNPVSSPGPVPIAPQIKNPQPVTLPPELAESLNAPVNNMSLTGGFAASAVAKNSQSTSSNSGQQKAGPSKPKKFVRAAGGETWEDPSLLDWDLSDFRVFCGDLGNEVTDEHLRRAFSNYPSLQKVKVVRDKRTNKTKGYGFLSFSDSNDYVRAMKEMNGKYVGNRPIKLRKSSWQERDIHQVRKKEKLKKKLGLR